MELKFCVVGFAFESSKNFKMDLMNFKRDVKLNQKFSETK
jgi:hypothetical protein